MFKTICRATVDVNKHGYVETFYIVRRVYTVLVNGVEAKILRKTTS
jgi:hypothetical protein